MHTGERREDRGERTGGREEGRQTDTQKGCLYRPAIFQRVIYCFPPYSMDCSCCTGGTSFHAKDVYVAAI